MVSYKIVPLPEESIDTEAIRAGIEATSALNSDEDLRSGMLPQTFSKGAKGPAWAEYGLETYDSYTTLEGAEKKTKQTERYAIIFLQNGYVAIEKTKKDPRQEILTTLAEVLDQGVKFETLDFDEEDLRTVIDESSRVDRVEVNPNKREHPDQVWAQDRGDLRDTHWWDQHSWDRFEQVRVDLPDRNIEVEVAFDTTGRITLRGREMEMAIQAEAMQYLIDEIIDPHRDPSSFQGTFDGF